MRENNVLCLQYVNRELIKMTLLFSKYSDLLQKVRSQDFNIPKKQRGDQNRTEQNSFVKRIATQLSGLCYKKNMLEKNMAQTQQNP